MKTYTCDICKKQFGHNVGLILVGGYSGYNKSDFTLDAGFYATNRTDADICHDCYARIAKAQEDEIQKIKSEKSFSEVRGSV